MSRRNWFEVGGQQYAQFRPTYPPALAAYLAELAPAERVAVDVGCGNGQFTVQLAEHFASVIGADPSAEQLANAKPHPRVQYVQAPAEELALADASVGLVAVAQAAHWFDLPRFYAEVRRVAALGCVLALITYGRQELDADLNERFQRFYRDEIGPFWPVERAHVDAGYRTLDFPFEEVAPPRFEIVKDFDLPGMLGYVSTWSAVTNARLGGRTDILERFATDLTDLWGDPARRRAARWPISLRVAPIDSGHS
ncbi:MAG: class I SAM-dependent methyltransferase [Propionibacteriaceae bacterium]|nr:class I SAM-dependent methyltransferase [Propionibacteriaceae bacterium]